MLGSHPGLPNFEPVKWSFLGLIVLFLAAGYASVTGVVQRVVDDPDNGSR